MTTPFHLANARLDSGELVTMRQIADMAGVKYWYIRALSCGAERTYVPFPRAATRLGRSPLWRRSDIEEWLHDRGVCPNP